MLFLSDTHTSAALCVILTHFQFWVRRIIHCQSVWQQSCCTVATVKGSWSFVFAWSAEDLRVTGMDGQSAPFSSIWVHICTRIWMSNTSRALGIISPHLSWTMWCKSHGIFFFLSSWHQSLFLEFKSCSTPHICLCRRAEMFLLLMAAVKVCVFEL